jgi:hypothetical protein
MYRIFFFILISIGLLQAQTNWSAVVKTVASDRASGDYYGMSVAISGEYAIAGALGQDLDASGGNSLMSPGAAYILSNSSGSWQQVQKIAASERAAQDFFGHSVAISGDYAIVGAYGDDEDVNGANQLLSAGSAFIFVNNSGTWQQVQKITAADRAANAYFGSAVAISGDYAIVGAYGESTDAAGTNSLSGAGAAYVFFNNNGTWQQVNKLVASDRAASDWFGNAVAISGNYAIVGAPYEDEDAAGGNTAGSAGSAYIFANNAGDWQEAQKITASDRAGFDIFGASVAIYEGLSGAFTAGYAVVGAPNEDEDAGGANTLNAAGSVYVFKSISTGSWIELQKIAASDRIAGDSFGSAVAIDGDYLIAGALNRDENDAQSTMQADCGAAYIYENIGVNFQQERKIRAEDRAANDYFGQAVAISGGNVIAGANREDEDAAGNNTLADAGSAYFYNNGSDGSLPVELASFSATAGDGQVTLRWVTESEVNNDAFIIERSLDGGQFEIIEEIAGHGSSSEQHIYRFSDQQVFNGIVYYYRLSDRDYNGVITTLNVVSAVPNSAGIVATGPVGKVIENYHFDPAYPNPFNPETTLRFAVPNNEGKVNQVRLHVYNMLGQRVATLYDGPLAGGEFSMKWNGLSDAGKSQPSGVYIIRFSSRDYVDVQRVVLLR